MKYSYYNITLFGSVFRGSYLFSIGFNFYTRGHKTNVWLLRCANYFIQFLKRNVLLHVFFFFCYPTNSFLSPARGSHWKSSRVHNNAAQYTSTTACCTVTVVKGRAREKSVFILREPFTLHVAINESKNGAGDVRQILLTMLLLSCVDRGRIIWTHNNDCDAR